MKTTTKTGWRNMAPGTYVKNIMRYGDIEYGATAQVQFVPNITCIIIDAEGVHVATPSPADAEKFIGGAREVYGIDTEAETERLRKREYAKTNA